MIYLLTKLVLRLYFTLILKIHIQGLENIPRHQAAIMEANHPSTLDAFLMISAVKRKMYIFGKADYFKKPILGKFLKKCNGIPVKNEKYNRASLENTGNILDENKLLLIFPEGRVNQGFSMLLFKSGFVKLALKHHVPIIPVAITGSNKALKLGQFLPRAAEIFISIMNPVSLNTSSDEKNKIIIRNHVEKIKKIIMEKIAKMKIKNKIF